MDLAPPGHSVATQVLQIEQNSPRFEDNHAATDQ